MEGKPSLLDHGRDPASKARVPLWLKVVYSVFVSVLVPYYWVSYGPINFLYFCDIALLVTLPAIWLENRLLVSVQAVAILAPQLLWVVDFICTFFFGKGPIGMSGYMFNANIPVFVRGMSSFHGWMPFLLFYLVWRLGYDRRAYAVQCVCGIALLLVCYFFTPAPPSPESNPNAAVNINYVFGPSDTQPQQWVAPGWWLTFLIVLFPSALYLPTHLALFRLFGSGRSGQSTQGVA